MAINQLSSSNTFQHWLIATQQLIAFANNITDGGPNSEFVINSALTVTGTINAQNGIVTTNISTTNLFANDVITTNIVSSFINTNSALINVAIMNVANINVANVNTIFFSDGSSLNSNSFIVDLSTLGQSAFDKANSANVLAQAAFDKANTTDTILITSFDKTNAAFDKANSANVLAQAAFDKANSAASINAVDDVVSTTLYPVMVDAAGVDRSPNVTTSKYTFDASTGKLTVTGTYLVTGSTGAFGMANRSGGTTPRYSTYSNNNNFYVYDHIATQDKLTLTSTGFLGVGSNKTSPNAVLDWCETVSIHSSGTIASAASRTYILTGSSTVTLPASPNVGDWIRICNRGTTLTSTVSRNGSRIMGDTDNMTIDIANITFTLTYTDSTNGWVIT